MKFKANMMQEFEMSDIGSLSYFMGMKFNDTIEGVFLHQNKYAYDILKRFKMSKSNAAVTPFEMRARLRKDTTDELVSSTLYKQIIGSLRYIYTTSYIIFVKMLG